MVAGRASPTAERAIEVQNLCSVGEGEEEEKSEKSVRDQKRSKMNAAK